MVRFPLPPRLLATLPLLALPSALAAQDMNAGAAQQQQPPLAPRMGMGSVAPGVTYSPSAAAAVAEWQSLTRDPRPSFDRVARFLIANPGWPQETELRRNADAALDPNGFIPASAAPYYDRFQPSNAGGWLRYALALQSAGRQADAMTAARRAWTTGALSDTEEARLQASFPGALSVAEHDARMERLLWSGSTTGAERVLWMTSPAKRTVYTARLAMRQRATAAALRAAEAEAADPSLLRNDAGYIADKALWLSGMGRGVEAAALLAGRGQLRAAPLDADAWISLHVDVARAALASGRAEQAYQVARRVDDALPPGAAILQQPLGVRDAYTDAVWLAATTAHRQLRRPREAAALYELYSGGGRSPQVQAKGLYWAGRAALEAGDAASANGYFTRAGRHFDQFHGQLALERLGQAQPRPVTGTQSFSQAERDAFFGNSLVRAARSLGETGQWRDQSLFLRAIANNATTDADHYFAGELARQIGRPDLAVMVGRSARTNGLDDYVPVAFPTTRVPAGYEGDWTFIHAISRQESQFDRAAMSRVGARGLMQLMPGTAREQSGKLGLGYNLDALTTDPQYNIMLGSSYFRRMVDYYGGSYPLAVAAYNAGPGNVNRWLNSIGDPRTGQIDILDWIEAIPLSETRGYVQRVLENAVVYETLRPGQTGEVRNRLSTLLGKQRPG